MRTYSAFTTFSKNGYEEYGYRNIDTFIDFWPKDINYFIYTEDFNIKNTDRIKRIDINKNIPDLMSFKDKHKDNPKAHGKIGNRYDFMYDFVKFSHKSYVMFHAIENLTTDWIIWLDGDTVTHTKVDEALLNSVCDPEFMISYLGRDNLFSETGFLAFNRRHPKILEYVKIAKNIYDNELVYSLKEFSNGHTDCHVFDYSINILKNEGVKFNNISGHLKNSKHPFINCILGQYMDHLKGNRKALGRSNPIDIKANENKNLEYWKKK